MQRTTALFCAVIGGLVATSQADFVLLDDFESYSTGAITSQSTNWSAGAINDATVGSASGNQYLVQGTVNNAHTIFDNGSTLIADESIGTYFFRAYMPSATHVGASISPIDAASTGDHWNDGKAIIRFGSNPVNTRIFGYNNPSYTTLSTSSESGSWYNLWVLIDNTTGNRNYDVWMQSDDDATYATQTLVGSDLAFRQGTADGDLQSLFFRSALNSTTAYFDDLYIDSAAHNLINPIPEPGTLGLVAIFGGGVLVVRRRFMI